MIPYLRKKGSATQLMVDDLPWLILGGELGNSSGSSLEYMRDVWPKARALNMNTVLVPAYWELLEPEEGHFDFTLVDGLIAGARANGLKLVFLWFGAWKNSMSCYAPLWVKKDTRRFPRMVDERGARQEILSAFSDEVLAADIKAFTAFLARVKKIDSRKNTVIMIQVENEIGMLPTARDMSAEANRLYAENVPERLLSYLDAHRDSLAPSLRERWAFSSFRLDGSWEEVFGPGSWTEEFFMAWHYAAFVERLASSGKAEYALPMYVNAALNRSGMKPGEYPSAGPLPHLIDVWKAGAPTLDFLSPDLYFPDYDNWISRYKRADNPLFVPENQLGAFNGAYALHTIGTYDAIGYSPFSFESSECPERARLAHAYRILGELSPVILERQGLGVTTGALLSSVSERAERALNGYVLRFRHEKDWLKGPDPIPDDEAKVGCVVIATGEDEFIIAGSGILVTFFSSDGTTVGIGAIDEISVVDGRIRAGRRLNGDQDHQGRHLHLPFDSFGIQRVRLYRY